MREYETYKDSGVEWIGKIPSHWDVRKGSTLGKYSKGRGIKKDDVVPDGLPCVRYGEIYTIYDHSIRDVTSRISESISSELTSVNKGTLLLTSSGETLEDIGKCVVFLGEGRLFVGGDIITLHPNGEFDSEFLSYLINSDVVRIQRSMFGRGDIIVHISVKHFRDMRFPTPPLPEQHQIVSYLNEKTSLIDEIIENKTQRIELLKEMRSSLISEVVTKGLNPNVPMKDSGVEWIGEIPSHWGHKKVKYMFSVLGGGTPSTTNPEFWSGDIPWVSPKDMKSDVIVDTEDHLSELGVQESSTTKISEGSVLLVFRSGILRHQIPVSMTSREVTINQDIKSFNSNDRRLNRYLFYLVRGSGTVLLDMWRKEGTTVESLDLRTVLDSEIPLPPPTEQEQLTSFLGEKTSMIDEEMSREIRSIGYLNEVRQSLINEVVTGKMDVRGVPTS